MYKIGIDVGGTNTDAVILDYDNHVLESIKTATTPDVETGILNALDQVLGKAAVNPKDIKYVMLGTTHATNAIIERKHLAQIAVVRICLPAGKPSNRCLPGISRSSKLWETVTFLYTEDRNLTACR